MQLEQSAPLEHILGQLMVGFAILDGPAMRVRSINPYLFSLLDEPWRSSQVVGRTLSEILPPEMLRLVEPPLRQAYTSGETLHLIVEDVTGKVRSRMHIEAIHYISSAIAGRFALPHVLERTLQAVQELVGSTRCAILLIESSVSGNEPRGSHFQARYEDDKEQNGSPRVNIAAQKVLHLSSQRWQPQVGEHLLLV